jgi:hypothetical protein
MPAKYIHQHGDIPLQAVERKKWAMVIDLINQRTPKPQLNQFIRIGWPKQKWAHNVSPMYLSDKELDQIRAFVTAVNEREVRQQLAKRARKVAAAQAEHRSRLWDWRRRREKEIKLQVRNRYPRPYRDED